MSPFMVGPLGIEKAYLLTTDTQQFPISSHPLTTVSPLRSPLVLDGPARNGQTMDKVELLRDSVNLIPEDFCVTQGVLV